MKTNVKKPLTSSIVLAVIALAAFPLSQLLIAQPNADAGLAAKQVETEQQFESGDSTDAVSAMMAGDVVGRSRDCSFGLRRPASAFVP